MLSIYITIECIRGTTGRAPLIIINTEKTTTPRGIGTEINHGLPFTSYCYRGHYMYVHRENKLFDIITIWEMTAQ